MHRCGLFRAASQFFRKAEWGARWEYAHASIALVTLGRADGRQAQKARCHKDIGLFCCAGEVAQRQRDVGSVAETV